MKKISYIILSQLTRTTIQQTIELSKTPFSPFPSTSEIEIDLKEIFSFKNFETLEEIKFTSTLGKVGWNWKKNAEFLESSKIVDLNFISLINFDDQVNCYFTSMNETHVTAGTADSTTLTIKKAIKFSKEELFFGYKSFKSWNIWNSENKNPNVYYRIYTYIDKYNCLRFPTLDGNFRIVLEGKSMTRDYEVITKFKDDKVTRAEMHVEGVFYFKSFNEKLDSEKKYKAVFLAFTEDLLTLFMLIFFLRRKLC